MKNNKEFSEKVALVTGAGTGIGAATAKMLASRGARVMLLGRRLEPLEAVTEAITKAGGDAQFVQADVSNAKQMEEAISQTVKTFGALHYAVNNAGIIIDHNPVPDVSVEDWNKIIGINLSGIFFGMKYQIPQMRAAGGGAIVNISSVFSDKGFPLNAGYVTTKHGIRGLTRTAALECAKQGVRINEIQLGLFDTDLVSASPEQSELVAAQIPSGRMGKVDEAAEAICFLLSDKASYINGAQMAVDSAFLA